jgi:putative ABC transport system permease protein
MLNLWQDLRYAVRQMRKNPGFTLTAVLTLALGIGANAAIFMVLHGTLRLPFPHADQLVMVRNSYPGSEDTPGSLPDFKDWREQSKSFSNLVAISATHMTYVGKHEPMRIAAAYASDGFLSTFGLSPVLGRSFLASEHQKGAATVYVLSEGFWKEQFGGSPSVLGSTITLNGRAGTVIGVVPRMLPSFYYEPQVWIPLEAAPPYQGHGTNFLNVVGRLKDGVSLSAARSELAIIQGQIDKQFPMNAHGVSLRPLAQVMFGDIRSVTLILLAAVGFILLIACLNLANMLLARATDRMREFAIRNALGASMRRLLQQTITESLLLALLGGAVGLICAIAVTRLPLAMWPKFLLRPDQVSLDAAVILFTAGLAVLTGLFFGMIPALYVLRENFFVATREGRSLTETREQGITRSVLMISEIALATLLVTGALSMARYLTQLMHTDSGVNPDHVLSMNVSLSPSRYAKDEQQRQFFQQLVDKLHILPGVTAVAASSAAPFAGEPQSSDFEYEGQQADSSRQLPFAGDYFVSPEYFETMQLPILQGRSFDLHDGPGTPKVVIVNRTMAEALWPGQNAIGKWIKVLDGSSHQVVGIAGDVRSSGVSQPAGFQLYFSALQSPANDMTVLLRTTTEPLAIAELAKQTVYAIDPEQAVSNVTSADQLASDSIAAQRVSTTLSGSLGGLALLLASIGVYGVMAYSVSRREREFGIRMAMGAKPRDILAMLLRRSSYLVMIGVATGVALTIPLSRWVSTLMVGPRTFGALTLAAAGFLLAAVALFATYLPARRAASVQPMTALRTE